MKQRDVILVVDDTPGTLGVLNEVLEDAGYTVLMAQSAAAAMTILERVLPDVILIDAVMPGMDGFEACRRMKRNPALASVPIIFMTGLTESEDVVRGLEAGGVDYVTKPLQLSEVVARIRVHLTGARRTQSAQAALDTAGRFLLATDMEGELQWATPQAATLLGQLAPQDGSSGIETIAACPWVGDWLAEATDHHPGSVAATLGEGPLLQFVYVGRMAPDEILFRIQEMRSSTEEARLRDRLGLTAREAEVLLWIGHGKGTKDIAEILGMSPRTVQKHLEQIYAKLGVENRAAAAAIAIRTIG
ncbi:MAG TPA: response regulator transcription factor [Acidisoma sp.]|uniref:response regulator transcription factor n=1 Tax=Acidisoma sp. TaxID=1872115 RepID=UPI002CA1EE0F|nr:response regulator transcription factor [Acidisoma sp.]HTI03151.1 response regulator transcription factor [Acidisoma sp.]